MTNRPADPNNLDSWFDNSYQSAEDNDRLGVVVGGSISKGLAVKLDPSCPVEDLAVGRYVVIGGGQKKRFFCMVNDISLSNTNPLIESYPPDFGDPFLKEVYSGTIAYSVITVIPMLVIDEQEGILPVKTIPAHFTVARTAGMEDVDNVFGEEGANNFNVGSPLELQETNIHLNLKRLVERSTGVFGKSGTGKSFLTRVLLAGTIFKKIGVTLIFDMHNDYGWAVQDESGIEVKGLKQLFPDKVVILTLDPESSTKRKAKYDYQVQIGYDEIEPEDIAMLKGTLNLSDTMVDAAYTLRQQWGREWVARLIRGSTDDMEFIVESTSIGNGTLNALKRRIDRFERWGFLVEEHTEDSVQRIIQHLVNEEKSVVLEFGRYGNNLDAYMLVANYLTRRIHESYVDKMERALGDKSQQPPQLLITIEEAHKFLEPQVARQTTFGIIAREMRKYNVTLLVVDQRPSGIDEEVMSQIGTRVTALLDNERDINAVLNGISGSNGLREVLARLETKQQAIIMGHAVPMPVVIKPRTYDADFYQSFTGSPAKLSKLRESLGNSGNRRL